MHYNKQLRHDDVIDMYTTWKLADLHVTFNKLNADVYVKQTSDATNGCQVEKDLVESGCLFLYYNSPSSTHDKEIVAQ